MQTGPGPLATTGGEGGGEGGAATAAATALTYGSWIEHHCRHCSCSIHDPYVSAVAEDLLVNIHESGSYSPRTTILPQVILVDIGLACMQASPDRAHGARVQIVARLEENRRKN